MCRLQPIGKRPKDNNHGALEGDRITSYHRSSDVYNVYDNYRNRHHCQWGTCPDLIMSNSSTIKPI